MIPHTPDWRRLHPATVIVEVAQRVASLAWFLAVAALLLLFGGAPDSWEYVIAGMALLQVLAPLHTYMLLRYAIVDDALIIRSGLFFRRLRTIRLERVQHINLRRGPLHRYFGVAALTVETAGGAQPEAELSVVSEDEAQALREELMRRRGGIEPARSAAEPAGEVLWAASLRDLLILGLTENRVAVIIGVLAGAWHTLGDQFTRPLTEEFIEKLDSGAVEGATMMSVAIGIALLVLGLVFAGSVLSIIMSIVTHYGFTLRRSQEKLRRQYGLLTQHETLLPVNRVQVVKIVRPWLRRLLGYATIYVETAGSVTTDQRAGATPLCPLIKEEQVGKFVRLVFSGVAVEQTQWQPVSRRTIGRGFRRYAAVLALIVTVLAAGLDWRLLYLLIPAAALAAWMARQRYRSLGFARLDGFTLVRSGVLVRRTWVVPRSKVQLAVVTQSPFQRRHELGNLSIITAGSSHLDRPIVVDLERPTAAELQDELARDADLAGAWQPDGV